MPAGEHLDQPVVDFWKDVTRATAPKPNASNIRPKFDAHW